MVKWYQGRECHITAVKWYQGRKCHITAVKWYQGRKCYITVVKWYQGRKCFITAVKWYQGRKCYVTVVKPYQGRKCYITNRKMISRWKITIVGWCYHRYVTTTLNNTFTNNFETNGAPYKIANYKHIPCRWRNLWIQRLLAEAYW